MPITTQTAAALVGGVQSGRSVRVTFKKQTFVSSLGRNSSVGETQEVSEGDARFLIAYRYAVKATEEAPKAEVKAEEPVAVEEAAVGEPIAEEVEESADEPVRRFSRRRRGGE